MPTTKPRITVTLTERQHQVLRSLSICSGQSMSAYIVEFLDLALPTLERMAATLQAVSNARESDLQRVRDQLDEAQRVFEPMAMEVVSQADLFLGRVERAATDSDGRSPAGAGGAGSSSPRTNRGVTPTCAKASKPKPGAASGGVRGRSLVEKKSGAKRAI